MMIDKLREIGIPYAYSEVSSKGFWDVINSLPEAQRDTAYSLGVALQNVEHDLRRLIGVQITAAEDPKPVDAEPTEGD